MIKAWRVTMLAAVWTAAGVTTTLLRFVQLAIILGFGAFAIDTLSRGFNS
jgi:hypothetical protein